jgi:hypothetical protein
LPLPSLSPSPLSPEDHRKIEAHDDYVTATRRMRERSASIERSSAPRDYKTGYQHAIRDFAVEIVTAHRDRLDYHEPC